MRAMIIMMAVTMSMGANIDMIIEYTTEGVVFNPIIFLNVSSQDVVRIVSFTQRIDVIVLGCDYGYYDQGGMHCVPCVCEHFDESRTEQLLT